MGDQEFVSAAKKAIVKAFNERKGSLHPPLKEEELYVVWLAKALQNNKALLATNRSGDGLYFEVTNNGDKNEMYLDVCWIVKLIATFLLQRLPNNFSSLMFF